MGSDTDRVRLDLLARERVMAVGMEVSGIDDAGYVTYQPAWTPSLHFLRLDLFLNAVLTSLE